MEELNKESDKLTVLHGYSDYKWYATAPKIAGIGNKKAGYYTGFYT